MAYFQVTCLFCLCILGRSQVWGESTSMPKQQTPGGGKDTKFVESGKTHHVLIPQEDQLSKNSVYYEEASPFIGTFSQDYQDQGIGEKRRMGGPGLRTTRIKRTPTGFTARGFHEGVFDRDFGHFSPVKRTQKRKPEADAAGFYGDTFSNGFGEFETMKRDSPSYALLNEREMNPLYKRRSGMGGASGFHGDTFAQGFGEFDTMKRQYPYNNWIETMKRKPEMTKSGFHGDVFNGGFGEFHPMRK